jgi:hypothetical protein
VSSFSREPIPAAKIIAFMTIERETKPLSARLD